MYPLQCLFRGAFLRTAHDYAFLRSSSRDLLTASPSSTPDSFVHMEFTAKLVLGEAVRRLRIPDCTLDAITCSADEGGERLSFRTSLTLLQLSLPRSDSRPPSSSNMWMMSRMSSPSAVMMSCEKPSGCSRCKGESFPNSFSPCVKLNQPLRIPSLFPQAV